MGGHSLARRNQSATPSGLFGRESARAEEAELHPVYGGWSDMPLCWREGTSTHTAVFIVYMYMYVCDLS